jgi:uncharacterized protein YoxC
MELFVIGAAFIFLALIVATVMIGISFVVYRDRVNIQSNLSQIGGNFNLAMTEFNKGIEANAQLAKDLNTKLEEVDQHLGAISHLDNRVSVIEQAVKLKTSSAIRPNALRN